MFTHKRDTEYSINSIIDLTCIMHSSLMRAV